MLRRELTMSSLRTMPTMKSVLFICTVFLLAGCASDSDAPEAMPDAMAAAAAVTAGNPITGDGLPNPAPTVMRNWGTLPEGREWGSTEQSLRPARKALIGIVT